MSTRVPSDGPATDWICSDRVTVSGLYCIDITPCTTDVSGSMVTMLPLIRRGESGLAFTIVFSHFLGSTARLESVGLIPIRHRRQRTEFSGPVSNCVRRRTHEKL